MENRFRINKVLKKNLPSVHETTSGIDDLYFTEDGGIFISTMNGEIVEINKTKISDAEDNAIEYIEATETNTEGLYYKDYTNREVLEKFSVNDDGQLLYDGNLINIDISTDEGNILVLKDNGLYVPIDTELSTTSTNPVTNKAISQEFARIELDVTNAKKELAAAITTKGVNSTYTDTFDDMIEKIGQISSGGASGNASIKIGKVISSVESEALISSQTSEKSASVNPAISTYNAQYVDEDNGYVHYIIGAKHYVYDLNNHTWDTGTIPAASYRGFLGVCQNRMYLIAGGTTSDVGKATNAMYFCDDAPKYLTDWTNLYEDGTTATAYVKVSSPIGWVAPENGINGGEECIFLAYGYNGSSNIKTCSKYIPSTKTWTALASGNLSARRNSLCYYDKETGILYQFFGYVSSSVKGAQKYNIATNTWTTLADPPIADDGAGAMSITAKINDEIYLSCYYKYNITTNTWSYIQDNPTSNYPHNDIGVNDSFYYKNLYYIIGGRPADPYLTTYVKNNFTIFDATNNFEYLYSLTNNPFYYAGNLPMIYYHDKIYLCGNRAAGWLNGANTNSNVSNQMWEYDITSNQWTRKTNVPYLCGACSMVVFNDEIHILGGTVSPYNQHYVYNSITDEYIQYNNLPFTLTYAYRSAIVYDNTIHVLGSAQGTKTIHYKWDQVSDSWTSVSTLPYAFYHGSALVLNGKLHILSGYGDGNGHYVFDDTTATWIKQTDLPASSTTGIHAFTHNKDIYTIIGSTIYKLKNEDDIFSANTSAAFGSVALNSYPSCIDDNNEYIYFVTNCNLGTAGYNNVDGFFRFRLRQAIELESTEKIFIENSSTWVNANTPTEVQF